MTVPIVKRGDNLIATVRTALTDDDLTRLCEALVERATQDGLHGLLVDATGLDVVDSFTARTLRQLGRVAGLRGARTVIVGIQPEIVSAMRRSGITLDGVAVADHLEAGLACLARDAQRDLSTAGS